MYRMTDLQEKLLALQDLKYRKFHQSLCPNADTMIGVRMPELRKIARQIAKQDFREFLSRVENKYYEETMIEGIVIATAKMDLAERLGYLQKFIPKIDNWAICDSVAASFNLHKNDKPGMWDFLTHLQTSSEEFTLRFMLVMLLDHYLGSDYIDEIIKILNAIKLDRYYVNMAEAWLIAEMLTVEREKTLQLLQNNQLSDFIHNKAIQKARESYRISDTDKQRLLALKRAPHHAADSASK